MISCQPTAEGRKRSGSAVHRPPSLILGLWTLIHGVWGALIEQREWHMTKGKWQMANGVGPGLGTFEGCGTTCCTACHVFALLVVLPSSRVSSVGSHGGIPLNHLDHLDHFMLYLPRSLNPHGAFLSDLRRFAFPWPSSHLREWSKSFRFCRWPESLSSATAETARNSPKQPQPAAAQRGSSHPEGVAWLQMWS